MKDTKKLNVSIEDFNGHVGKNVNGFEGVQGEMELESEIWMVEGCWNSAIRRIFVWQIHGLTRRKGR